MHVFDGGLKKQAVLKECGPSYEIDTLTNGETEYVLACSKDQPVHLWDLASHKVVTQYVCRNQVEEVISAISLKATATNLFTGHSKGILKVFDI